MDIEQRARELAMEHDLHVVVAGLRGGVPDELRPPMRAEAAKEARALIDAEERPVWWVEEVDGTTLMVVDALAQSLKEALVAFEDDHLLGQWFNFDVVTVMDDGRTDVWHHTPMRPVPRPLPDGESLWQVLQDYDWS